MRKAIILLMIWLTPLAFASDAITMSGEVSDIYSDQIHLYVEGKFIAVLNVPDDVIKKVQKIKGKKITLKVERVGKDYSYLSMEKEE